MIDGRREDFLQNILHLGLLAGLHFEAPTLRDRAREGRILRRKVSDQAFEHLFRLCAVDIGKVDDGTLPRHSEDAVFDAQCAL